MLKLAFQKYDVKSPWQPVYLLGQNYHLRLGIPHVIWDSRVICMDTNHLFHNAHKACAQLTLEGVPFTGQRKLVWACWSDHLVDISPSIQFYIKLSFWILCFCGTGVEKLWEDQSMFFFFKTTFTFDNKSIDKGLTGDNQRVAEEFWVENWRNRSIQCCDKSWAKIQKDIFNKKQTNKKRHP